MDPGYSGKEGGGEVAHTQQQVHALPEEDLLHFLTHRGQELLVSQGYLGMNKGDLRTKQPQDNP